MNNDNIIDTYAYYFGNPFEFDKMKNSYGFGTDAGYLCPKCRFKWFVSWKNDKFHKYPIHIKSDIWKCPECGQLMRIKNHH